jgi:hypothetical protein
VSHVFDIAAPDDAFHQAMLVHEAAAANLHHHAAIVQNIRNLVHVILDLTDDNYKRWRDQLLVVGKYSLEETHLHLASRIGAAWIASSSPGSLAPSPPTL